MKDPLIIDEPRPSRFGWTRARVVFLALSGAAVVATLLWASEVVLPFIMALIIAYVLTPAVELCERAKLPRALSITWSTWSRSARSTWPWPPWPRACTKRR